MDRSVTRAVVAVALFAGASTSALGSIFHEASDYNVFTFGSLHYTNSSIGGRVAAGGSVAFQNVGLGGQLAPSFGGRDDVVAAGSVQMINGQVAGGNLRYAGVGLIRNAGFPNGSAYRADSPISFENARAALQNTSLLMADLQVTGDTAVRWGGITLTGTSDGTNVFSLSGADLWSATSLTINASADSTVIINVDGSNQRMQNFGFSLQGGVEATDILFNFFETTSLRLTGVGVQGSVLAPFANVHFTNGQLNGQLIASSLQGSGAINNAPFTGLLRTVPAPGAAALACLAMGVTVTRRRR